MSRAILFPLLLLSLALADNASATTLPADDLQSPGPPCALSVSDIGSARTLSWSSVSGASSYKVGYRRGNGTIVGLAEITLTSYVHTGFDPNECLEYVMVAYDSGGTRICSASVPNIGLDCSN
jgi:hypothetical protein